MIRLIYSPQRADIKVKYQIDNDVLIVKTGEGEEEIFDFTGLDEGVAEEIITEALPINPIMSAKKLGNVVTIKVIRFYSEDEKELFENGSN